MAVAAKGLEGIIANESKLSNVVGSEGNLSYLGYTIDELVGATTFEEVVHLLHRGKLPNPSELESLTTTLRSHRNLPEGIINFLKTAPADAGPMDVVRTGISMLGLYDTRGNHQDRAINEDRSLAIIAKIPLIVAGYHRARQGLDIIDPHPQLNEAAHFLYLINGEEPSTDAAKTLDVAYILHADHGMNASTFSSRVTIATLSDIYSAITSALSRDHCTAAPTRASFICWRKSVPKTLSMLTWRVNLNVRKKSWVSGTAYIRCSTPGLPICVRWRSSSPKNWAIQSGSICQSVSPGS